MQEQKEKVWDIGVRVFHWSLVTLFVIAYLTGDEESDLHAYAGYAIGALLAFRLVWGLVGTRYARFTQFLTGPSEVKQYLLGLAKGSPKHYVGHNPAGGWMVVLLLLFLIATVVSGLKAYGLEGQGPLAQGNKVEWVSVAQADDDEAASNGGGKKEGEEFWEGIHEFFANFTLLLIGIHISGVLVSSLLHKENLARAMITGMKNKKT